MLYRDGVYKDIGVSRYTFLVDINDFYIATVGKIHGETIKELYKLAKEYYEYEGFQKYSLSDCIYILESDIHDYGRNKSIALVFSKESGKDDSHLSYDITAQFKVGDLPKNYED